MFKLASLVAVAAASTAAQDEAKAKAAAIERARRETEAKTRAAALEQAREQISDLEVKSTLSGIVENRIAQVGGFVGAGDPVLNVTSLNPLKITADAGERQVADFEIGQLAMVELATGQKVLQVERHQKL